MDHESRFRELIHKIADGLTQENVKMIRYLCKDAVPHGMEFPTALTFFEYFEAKGWITFSDMSFLAEVLYRIYRHDLLKLLPGIKNRRDYEDTYLVTQSAQNFTPFRIACFQLMEELTTADFNIVKNFCKGRMSNRNYQHSTDVNSLLICLEEEDLMSDGDLDFILNSLRHLDNQTPYNTFHRLSQGDTTITFPKKHQSTSSIQSNISYLPKAYYDYPHSQSVPQLSQTNVFSNQPTSSYQFGSNIPFASHQNWNRDRLPLHDAGLQASFDGSKSTTKTDMYVSLSTEASRTFSEPDSELSKPVSNTPVLNTYFQAPSTDGMSRQIPDNTEMYMTDRSHPSSNIEQPLTGNTRVKGAVTVKDSNPMTYLCQQEINSITPSGLSDLSSGHVIEDPSDENLPSYPPVIDFTDNRGNSTQPFVQELVDTENSEQHTFANVGDIDQEDARHESVDAYAMNKVPTGICLIINNRKFEGSVNTSDAERRLQAGEQNYQIPNVGLKDRPGSEKDAQSVHDLFKTLGFKVIMYEDLDARAMKKEIMSISKMDHSEYDCFVAVIMSHGLEGRVYGTDGMSLQSSTIWRSFAPSHCNSLVNKPKIFFFQACQGDRRMEAHSANQSCPIDDVETDSPSNENFNYGTPSEADFLIGHSTVPGYLSYRSRIDGSWFIDALVSNVKKYHDKEDLLSIMIRVNNEMANKPFKQMSMPIATLRKKVYLKIQSDSTIKNTNQVASSS